ncbi:hypothetical protein, variant 1 [Aphanomyces astaci]|uniref:Metallo-beta-lactamase domain-containing protein n=1 Tax=Aphanomyces astaci TaxID=112090 RepID=W4G1Z4_APHAT|nr:hypothetical protein, variant 1 [Aphanomyces astaci]ETV73710.1 hypothetical protein, variant 1 [Aphanomyces astaci]|eukprot:XP_009836645.1 hypothetical protein, variant 1 [Aphanomyces astaci]
MSRRHLLSLRYCDEEVVNNDEPTAAAPPATQRNSTTECPMMHTWSVDELSPPRSTTPAINEDLERRLDLPSAPKVDASTAATSPYHCSSELARLSDVKADPVIEVFRASPTPKAALGATEFRALNSFASTEAIQAACVKITTPPSNRRDATLTSRQDADAVVAFSDSDDDDIIPATQRIVGPISSHPRVASSSLQSPAVQCPSCGKVLTFLNERGQLQHVNACLDQLEQFAHNKATSARSSATSSVAITHIGQSAPSTPAVMPCTVCGVDLVTKTSSQRVNHVKQCGRRFGVTLHTLRIDDDEAPSPPPQVDLATNKPAVSTPNAFDMLMKNAQTSSMTVPTSTMGILQPPPPSSKKRKPSGGQRGGGAWSFKSKEGMPCPQYKLIAGSSIVVDGFQYAKPSLSKVYFLSHFHSDHYTGLSKSFSAGVIYCTAVTAKLVLLCLGVNKKYIHPLPLNQPHVLADQQGQVTLIEANHCPGAALFLFQLRGGKTYLHTGDFRYDPTMLDNRFLMRYAHQSPALDGVYLDTTYCEPQHCHPTQTVAIDEAKRLVNLHDADRALFLFGSYSIGKERLFMDIARHLQRKVYVERSKYSLLSCFDWPDEDMAMVTLESSATNLHVVPMRSLNFDVMGGLLTKHRLRFHKVIAFQPTGWTFSGKKHKLSSTRMQMDGKLIIYGIPYRYICTCIGPSWL